MGKTQYLCLGNRFLSYMSGKYVDWLNLFEELFGDMYKNLKDYSLLFFFFAYAI